MRHRGVRDGLNFVDLEDSQVREPSVEAEQGIVIGADSPGRCLASDDLIEQAGYCCAIDELAADAETDESTGIHVDHHEDPVATKQDRLTTKQIGAPKTVLGVCARKVSQEGPEDSGYRP